MKEATKSRNRAGHVTTHPDSLGDRRPASPADRRGDSSQVSGTSFKESVSDSNGVEIERRPEAQLVVTAHAYRVGL
jgi:hypothetical protein